ncbi:MAG TPA: NAD(P)-binding protein [Steroidobacteraceae bacterium]|nr:NAD(P)-binding protein [Steroidobacteraceae bacterium]
MQKDKDRALGMHCPITRRDFLNGIAFGSATWASSRSLLAAASSSTPEEAQNAWVTTPPGSALTGLRGSHPGSFEAAHALRDGEPLAQATDTGEQYDLVVVGAGISGLAAAHFYRAQTAADRRILILDNHDDFGGHAKRNEFNLDGHLHLMNGGTLEIDSPRPYGPVADGLLRTLGIDVEHLARTTQHLSFYDHLGLKPRFSSIVRPSAPTSSWSERTSRRRWRHAHSARRPCPSALGGKSPI